MAESYPHLLLQREVPVNEKRPRDPPRIQPPEDIPAHGRRLQQKLASALKQASTNIGGFDERRLFRFSVQKGTSLDYFNLRSLSLDIEFISQEGDSIVVGFVSDTALSVFESRLASLASTGEVTNKEVFYSLKSVDGWSSDDRKGWAIKKHGMPETDVFQLDVELWPLEDNWQERNQEWEAFESWLVQHGIETLDQIKQPSLTLYRVRCDTSQAEKLLRHRDVRSVDLPPSFGLDYSLLTQSIQQFPPINDPGDNAPGIVVLDSGLVTGHPLLGKAVGDAQSFLPGHGAADEHGHGTQVAGLALYGDFESSLKAGHFIPALRLFSGRILDKNKQNATGFIESQIEKAVRYFFKEYQCRVFNLSVNNDNRPYLGGHLSGLSLTLDRLSRELGVLFVVSAGNHMVGTASPHGLDWKNNYPGYLLGDAWKIHDPAPALNALTVGSLTRYDAPSYQPPNTQAITIAQPDVPSPFTCHGPSVDGAIKPELIAYGGNWAINTYQGSNYLLTNTHGLGVASTSHQSTLGYPFNEGCGTSMAAPQVAHLAASILREHPDASASLLRALLCAHAVMPEASQNLIDQEKNFRKVCGYGRVDETALRRSLENTVTLITNEKIPNKHHHFYEIPVPGEFTSKGKRPREISIALAYTPEVRTTRIKYRATRIDFRLVTESSLERVSKMFDKATDEKEYENIKETDTAHRVIGAVVRGKGTVQADRWLFNQFNSSSNLRKNKLFVVVTRNDFPWGEQLCATEEDYALVVCLRDRENEEARLYTQIRNQLQARMRGRAKV